MDLLGNNNNNNKIKHNNYNNNNYYYYYYSKRHWVYDVWSVPTVLWILLFFLSLLEEVFVVQMFGRVVLLLLLFLFLYYYCYCNTNSLWREFGFLFWLERNLFNYTRLLLLLLLLLFLLLLLLLFCFQLKVFAARALTILKRQV